MIPTDKPSERARGILAEVHPDGWSLFEGRIHMSIDVAVRAVEKALRSVAQEPVADDDDAEWLRRIATCDPIVLTRGEWPRLERIANRLQAKAPDLTVEEDAYARQEIHEACKPTGEDHRRY